MAESDKKEKKHKKEKKEKKKEIEEDEEQLEDKKEEETDKKEEDDEEIEKEKDTTPEWAKDAKGIPLSISIVERLRERAKETSETNKQFRALGWIIAHDGTLIEPRPVTVVQTGAHATVSLDGNKVYLDVGSTRSHNALIKGLGGKWISYKNAWEFPDKSILPKIRACFVTNEVKVNGINRQEKVKKTEKEVDKGEVKLSKMGDYLIIEGDTKPIHKDLKSCVPLGAMSWRAEECQWVINKKYTKEIEKKLEELKEEGRIDSFVYVDSDE